MSTNIIVALGLNSEFVSTRVVSAYDTFAEPPYFVSLTDKKIGMNCLIITLDGQGWVQNKVGQKRMLEKKSIYFGSINNLDNMQCTTKKWHFICIWYEPYGKEFPFDSYYVLKDLDVEKEEQDAKAIIELLLSCQHNETDQANALFTAKIITLLNRVQKHKEITSTTFEKILLYISKNLQNNVCIEDISREFGYCKKHIYYLFKRKLKETPGNYINKLKLERISSLLLTNNYSLSQLADMYNFTSPSHLIHNFKKEYGLTPKQYQLENSPL